MSQTPDSVSFRQPHSLGRPRIPQQILEHKSSLPELDSESVADSQAGPVPQPETAILHLRQVSPTDPGFLSEGPLGQLTSESKIAQGPVASHLIKTPSNARQC